MKLNLTKEEAEFFAFRFTLEINRHFAEDWLAMHAEIAVAKRHLAEKDKALERFIEEREWMKRDEGLNTCQCAGRLAPYAICAYCVAKAALALKLEEGT